VTFHILHVCTGNICRSPMAEHLMRAGLDRRGIAHVEVASAGTHGLEGHPVQEHAAAALAARDIASDAFRARRLVQDHVASADLVLAASREHRAAAVTLVPRAASRTFTLREFDRLLSRVDAGDLPVDPEDRAAALVRAAAGQRGLVRPDRPEDDDVTDPYGGPASGYPPCADLVERSLQRWLALMSH
jgi:protein-tyrosine phosphatase